MSEEVKVKGFSELCLAVIPWILGLAAVVWFGLYVSVHEFNRTVTQEKRAADWVGEKTPPKAAVKLVIKNRERGCTKIESAHFDGDDLWVYAQRICGGPGYAEIHWKAVAADGTVVSAGYDNSTGLESADDGERAEYKPYSYKPDPRTTAVILYTKDTP